MPNPNDYSNKDDFIKVCIPVVIKEGTAKDNNQAVAICNSMWDKKEMKLETVNIGDIEIFETGTWKGQTYTKDDIDNFIENFNNKIAEPYITIDHSKNATGQFKDALQAMALGFVEKLERRGNKLIAWFKQVPKTIADLIEAGALKKRSIEFYRNHIANGKLYKNVLQGVTFHGANGLPEVNTLSDYLSLYKSNFQTMNKSQDNLVSITIEDKKEVIKMAEIELKKDEYQELLKKSSQVDVLQNELNTFKSEFDKIKVDLKKIKDENETLKEEHETFEKRKKEELKKEADDYISKKVNDGYITPSSKEMYVDQYITYKSDDNKFKTFKEDIENRKKIINLAPTNNSNTTVTENFKYNPDEMEFKAGSTINYDELEENIQAIMKAKNCTWEEAALQCNAVVPEEVNKQEVTK